MNKIIATAQNADQIIFSVKEYALNQLIDWNADRQGTYMTEFDDLSETRKVIYFVYNDIYAGELAAYLTEMNIAFTSEVVDDSEVPAPTNHAVETSFFSVARMDSIPANVDAVPPIL
ncbi:MAG: hypothetical protein [Chaetfec virus UA24_144]|nr:MAG: hypothetical protein [Chaetfec virus UA24_144]